MSIQVNALRSLGSRSRDLAWLAGHARKVKRWRIAPDGAHVRDIISQTPSHHNIGPGAALVFDDLHCPETVALLTQYAPTDMEPPRILQANAILSAPGYQCAVHYDCQTIVSVQLTGTKIWRLEPATWLHEAPSLGWLDPASREPENWPDGVPPTPPLLVRDESCLHLAAGQSLRVPKGWWHKVWADDWAFSLTLTYVH